MRSGARASRAAARWGGRGLAALLAAGWLASGCGAGGGGPTARPGIAGGASGGSGGVVSYWTRERLLAARPWRRWAMPKALPPGSPTAHNVATGAPRVGALFASNASGGHFCTASVVQSPGRDLLMTAAHCVSDGNGHDNSDIVFIPGYSGGSTPYGVWTPRSLIVAPQWEHGADPDYDVAFVVLNPDDGRNIQDVLGANEISFDAGYANIVRVTGYPASGDAPVTCTNRTTMQSATQLRFDCGGFYGGTSGSPWEVRGDLPPLAPRVVGVIGGYQQGGDTPSVSYSVYLGAAVQKLYEQAEGAGAPGASR
jgi:V8-like Glu-specific endopeptidase